MNNKIGLIKNYFKSSIKYGKQLNLLKKVFMEFKIPKKLNLKNGGLKIKIFRRKQVLG